jgi:hypothetical protein
LLHRSECQDGDCSDGCNKCRIRDGCDMRS